MTLRTFSLVFLLAVPAAAQTTFDAALAKRLKADEYGMRTYVMAFLKAGPCADNDALRGIYVFDVPTIAETEALTKTDPAIQAGSLVIELHRWYGSAALMMVNEVHARIEQKQP